MKKATLLSTACLANGLLLFACSDGKPSRPILGSASEKSNANDQSSTSDGSRGSSTGKNNNGSSASIDDTSKETNQENLSLTCGKDPLTYIGLGKSTIQIGVSNPESDSNAKLNRMRIKSANALRDSYLSHFGEVPNSFAKYNTSFGDTQKYWYEATIPSAFTNYASFVMGYEVARKHINKDNSWSMRSSESEIKEGCKILAVKAWNRTVSNSEITFCVNYMKDPKLEKYSLKEKWSFALASILSSIEFLGY